MDSTGKKGGVGMNVELRKPEFIYLKQEDVIASGALDMPATLQDIDRVMKILGQGHAIQPVKHMLEFPDPETGHRKYLAVSMPAYLGDGVDRAGIKWAAESMDNARRGDLPYGIDILILHDLPRALPVAIMEASVITAMRTGATSGIAAKYLARQDAEVAGLVGAGVVGRCALEAIALALPGLREFRLFDIKSEKAQALAGEFKDRWNVRVVDSVQAAVTGADVIATMTTTRTPFVKAEWIKPGCFYAAIGKSEAEGQALLDADLLVTEDVGNIQHYEQAVVYGLLQSGKLSGEQIVNLPEIVVGRHAGRTDPHQRIHFLSYGMAAEDLIVAERIYQTARAKGLGQKLLLWDNPQFL